MLRKYIIIILIIFIALLFLYSTNDNQENLDTTSSLNLSNEAIQNIASVYNNQNMQVTALNATNSLTTPKIYSPNKKYSLAIQDDGNLVLYDISGNVKWDSMSAKISQTNYDAGVVFSADKNYKFIMQNDGNPAVWDPTATNLKWAGIEQMKSADGKYRLSLQNDGNLVVYNKENESNWASLSSIQYGDWARIKNSTGGNSRGYVFFKG